MANALERPESGDDDRVEVHAGVAVPKEAARFEHADAQGGIAVAIRGPFQRPPGGGRGGWWIAVEAEVAYPGSWVFLHDLAGWRRARVPDKPAGRPVAVAPDWVCEILSTNRRHDTVTKFEVLGRAGVGHYWLVDTEHRELVVHRRSSEGWVRVAAYRAEEPGATARIEPFETVELEIGTLFGDDPTV